MWPMNKDSILELHMEAEIKITGSCMFVCRLVLLLLVLSFVPLKMLSHCFVN